MVKTKGQTWKKNIIHGFCVKSRKKQYKENETWLFKALYI